MLEKILKKTTSLTLSLLLAGCALGRPNSQHGCLATPTLGTSFTTQTPSNPHGPTLYRGGKILYTLKGGHIDLVHVHNAANWVADISEKTYEYLMNNEEEFSFRLTEPSKYHLYLTYPKNWNSISENERKDSASQVSIALGQYLTYTAVTWHEILTWFGYKSTGFFSEYSSSFSWEDTFSNALGCRVGALAFQDTEHSRKQALEISLDNELKLLQVQPKSVAIQASEAMRGRWYSGDFLFFVSIDKRNFDIGLDGYVTPWLVPSISGKQEPYPYPVPNLDSLDTHGFSLKLELEPREAERNKILRIIYPNNQGNIIQPNIHFPIIMNYIKQQAVERYGPDVGEP